MDSLNRSVRTLISTMSPWRAVDYIQAFHLPEREEICIIEKDIYDLSYVQICEKHGFSPEVVKEARRRGYSKIVDGIRYMQEKGRW